MCVCISFTAILSPVERGFSVVDVSIDDIAVVVILTAVMMSCYI